MYTASLLDLLHIIFWGLIMPTDINTMSNSKSDVLVQDETLIMAMWRLMVPAARLCLAKGLTFAAAEDVLKKAFVQEANALQPKAPEHGMVSRISTATGINRREVTRLTKHDSPCRQTKPPLSAEIFARWTTDKALQNSDGSPSTLKRQGSAPSFEALAHEVTRDVHPRSMLDELIRLGVASYDDDLDCVSLIRSDFVPKNDSQQMISFLSNNVGDHLEAAVDNVLHDGDRHLEQAVFADELSSESIEALRPHIIQSWNALREAMVPVISDLIDADKCAKREQNYRTRIGLYTFTETVNNSEPTDCESPTCQYFRSSSKGNSK